MEILKRKQIQSIVPTTRRLLYKKKETRWFKFFNINSRTTHSSTLVGAAQEQKRLEWRKRGEPEVRNGKQKLELEYHFYDGKKGKGSTRSTLGMENKWRKAQQPLLQPQTVLVYILKNRLLLRKCTNGCIWWDRWDRRWGRNFCSDKEWNELSLVWRFSANIFAYVNVRCSFERKRIIVCFSRFYVFPRLSVCYWNV